MTDVETCPSEQAIAAFLAGEDDERIGAHLSSCPDCEESAARIERLTGPLVAALRKLGRGLTSGEPPADPGTTGVEMTAADSLRDRTVTAPAESGTWRADVGAVPPDYDILGRVGSGGMGEVFKARDRRLGRVVALKLIRAGSAAAAERFRVEAQAVARLQHPNIVQIYEVGEVGGRPFLALEYVSGGSLDQILHTSPPSPRQAAKLVRELAAAVHHAHGRGVIHRDLKPANVLIEDATDSRVAGFNPKVADFGIARLADTDSGMTRDGDILGTPSYMAPEQADGRVDRIGPATDVYSLGVILYEMMTGRVPFRGLDAVQTLLLVRSQEPVAPRSFNPKLPRDLETICLKCLAKEPGRRYASADVLADDLRRYLDGEPIRARPASAPERAWRWARRRPAVAGLSAALLLLLVILSVGSTVAALRIAAVASREARAHQELRQTLYESRMNLAAPAWESANLGRLRELLRPYRDGAADAELRGFECDYWWRLAHPGRLRGELRGHDRSIMHLEFSPDGTTLATAGSDRTLRLWDLARGVARMVLPVRFDDADFLPVAFSPDGARVAAPGEDGALMVWDTATGATRARLLAAPDRGRVWLLAFSPDGATLVAVYDRGAVKFWDPTGVTAHRELPAIMGGPTRAAISPDRRTLAVGLTDGTIALRDLATGSIVGRLEGQPPVIRSLVFSPDGTRLASGDHIGVIRLWDVPNRATLGEPLRGHAQTVWGLAFSPDGRTLASGSMDNTVELWDAASGRRRATLKGHEGPVYGLTFSHDGRALATAGNDRIVCLWDTADDGPRDVLEADAVGVDAMTFSADGSTLFTAGRSQAFKTWDVRTGALRAVADGPRDGVRALAIEPGAGAILATASRSGPIRLWDRATLSLRFEEPRWTLGAWAVAFSPDGRTLASIDPTGRTNLRDAGTGALIRTVVGPGATAHSSHSLAFTPDGSGLVLGSAEGYEVRDVGSGRRRAALPGPDTPSSLGTLQFSPDGSALATGFQDGTAVIWDAATWRPRATCRGHGGAVTGAAFSPDGRRLATSGRDRTVRLWDVSSGEVLTTLHGHTGNVMAVAFSPDGRTLASASLDGTVRLWRTLRPR